MAKPRSHDVAERFWRTRRSKIPTIPGRRVRRVGYAASARRGTERSLRGKTSESRSPRSARRVRGGRQETWRSSRIDWRRKYGSPRSRIEPRQTTQEPPEVTAVITAGSGVVDPGSRISSRAEDSPDPVRQARREGTRTPVAAPQRKRDRTPGAVRPSSEFADIPARGIASADRRASATGSHALATRRADEGEGARVHVE